MSYKVTSKNLSNGAISTVHFSTFTSATRYMDEIKSTIIKAGKKAVRDTQDGGLIVYYANNDLELIKVEGFRR